MNGDIKAGIWRKVYGLSLEFQAVALQESISHLKKANKKILNSNVLWR